MGDRNIKIVFINMLKEIIKKELNIHVEMRNFIIKWK
jgi:hypothetical protein